jgi:hypothetical protein
MSETINPERTYVVFDFAIKIRDKQRREKKNTRVAPVRDQDRQEALGTRTGLRRENKILQRTKNET